MHKNDVVLLFGLIGLFAVITFFYLVPLPGVNYTVITNSIFLIPPFIAVLAGLSAVKTYGLSNKHGKAFLAISLGMFSWFVGEVLWAVFQQILKIHPYPSIADFFYLAAYPLVLYGIYAEIGSYKTEISPKKSMFVSFFSVFLSLVVFYLMIVPVFNLHESGTGPIISISYGLADVLLIVGIAHIIVMATRFRGGRLYAAWLYILIASIFMLLADIFFSIYNAQYQMGIWPYKFIDLFYVGSYIAFAFGLFEVRFIVRDVQNKIRKQLTT